MRIRTYRCNDCSTYFKCLDDEPKCPHCSAQAAPLAPPKRSDLPSPGLLSDSTKIKNEVARQLMDEYKMTDMRDNQKPGDVAAPPLTIDQIKLRDASKGFWNSGVYQSGLAQVGANSGVPRDHAMKTVQNVAKRLEGHR